MTRKTGVLFAGVLDEPARGGEMVEAADKIGTPYEMAGEGTQTDTWARPGVDYEARDAEGRPIHPSGYSKFAIGRRILRLARHRLTSNESIRS